MIRSLDVLHPGRLQRIGFDGALGLWWSRSRIEICPPEGQRGKRKLGRMAP